MTSTEFNVGLGDGRCSSRVLKPPGGGQTNIFAAGADGVKSQIMKGHQGSEIKECFTFDNNEQKKRDLGNSENNEEKRKDEKAEPIPPRVRVPPGGFSSGFW